MFDSIFLFSSRSIVYKKFRFYVLMQKGAYIFEAI